LSFHIDRDDAVRTFGLSWHPASDTFHTDHKEPRCTASTIHACRENNKWQVASITASIFDPLGLVSLTVISYQIFHLQWDDSLPDLSSE
jgi:hypothetical protein